MRNSEALVERVKLSCSQQTKTEEEKKKSESRENIERKNIIYERILTGVHDINVADRKQAEYWSKRRILQRGDSVKNAFRIN